MPKFHAVMIDETGCEFGVDFEAATHDAADEYLADQYPESRCAQLETPEQSREREQRIYDHALAGGDYDDDGRPIFHN